MAIRWNPALVREALARIEAALAEARPFLEEAASQAREGQKIRDLPLYMSGRLMQFEGELTSFDKRCQYHLSRTKEEIPEAPTARTKQQEGPTLF